MTRGQHGQASIQASHASGKSCNERQLRQRAYRQTTDNAVYDINPA